jgi:hypothetical protein
MANSLNDSAKRYFERGIAVADGGTAEGSVVQDSRDAAKYQTVSAYNTATAPGAAGVVATLLAASLPAGYYKINVEASFDAGVPAVAERDNMELRAGASVLKKIIINPVASPTIGVAEFYRTMDGSTALTVNASGAATASVVYRASITATRLA